MHNRTRTNSLSEGKLHPGVGCLEYSRLTVGPKRSDNVPSLRKLIPQVAANAVVGLRVSVTIHVKSCERGTVGDRLRSAFCDSDRQNNEQESHSAIDGTLNFPRRIHKGE